MLYKIKRSIYLVTIPKGTWEDKSILNLSISVQTEYRKNYLFGSGLSVLGIRKNWCKILSDMVGKLFFIVLRLSYYIGKLFFLILILSYCAGKLFFLILILSYCVGKLFFLILILSYCAGKLFFLILILSYCAGKLFFLILILSYCVWKLFFIVLILSNTIGKLFFLILRLSNIIGKLFLPLKWFFAPKPWGWGGGEIIPNLDKPEEFFSVCGKVMRSYPCHPCHSWKKSHLCGKIILCLFKFCITFAVKILMMLKFRTYLFELILWVFLSAIAGWIFFEILLKHSFSSFAVIPATMIILGAIFYPILKKIPKISESKRILWFYLNIAIKMGLSLIIILFVAINDRENALFFIITFFVFYVLLMVFEVRCFTKVTKLTKSKNL
jgi:hypothetical protein